MKSFKQYVNESMTASDRAKKIAAEMEASGNHTPSKEDIVKATNIKNKTLANEIAYLVAKQLALVTDYEDWKKY